MNRHYYTDSTKKKISFILDIAVLLVCYEAALRLRYAGPPAGWQISFYRQILSVELLSYIILSLHRTITKKPYLPNEQDPVDNLVRVVKEQVCLFAVLLILLVAIKSAQQVSRLFLTYQFCLNTVVMYVQRMLYRQWLFRVSGSGENAVSMMIAADMPNIRGAVRRLRTGLPGHVRLSGIWLLEDNLQCPPEQIENIPVLGCGPVTDANEWSETLESALPAEAYFSFSHANEDAARRLMDVLLKKGVDVYCELRLFDRGVPSGILHTEGSLCTARLNGLTQRCRVLDIDYAVANVEGAASYIRDHVKELGGQYVCFSNAHTTVTAHEDLQYRAVQNGSAYTFADGSPVAKCERYLGFKDAQRVSGPDFMDAMFRASMDGSVTHYFYGSTQETIEGLKRNLERDYPGIVVKGLYSPPFRALSEEEDREQTDMINRAGADIIWIGLGAPKQEKWMAAHKGKVHGLMMGVGAGFNFYAGTVKRAPKWIQKIGLEWLYRLTQDPKRLFSRYFVTNVKFVVYVLHDYLWHRRGKV